MTVEFEGGWIRVYMNDSPTPILNVDASEVDPGHVPIFTGRIGLVTGGYLNIDSPNVALFDDVLVTRL